MKYSIRIFGYGAEVAFGYIDPETKDRLRKALSDGQELYEAVQDSDLLGTDWYEVSDVYRNFHANDEFNIEITDEAGEKIFEARAFDLMDNEEETIEYEYFNTDNLEEENLLMSATGEKGTFFVGEFEDDSFDLSKLKITIMGEIGTNDFYIDDMVSKIEYNGVELECLDMTTDNKSFDTYISM
jgi:hypothetical protein